MNAEGEAIIDGNSDFLFEDKSRLKNETPVELQLLGGFVTHSCDRLEDRERNR